MLIVSEGYGYIMVFENKRDLQNVINQLNESYNDVGKEEVKPPYLISFYTDTGVKTTFIKNHLKELKKIFNERYYAK